MSLVFALLNEAKDGVVRFDSGGDALELGDVASIVAEALDGTGVDRAVISESRSDLYVGDCATYAALLRQYRIKPTPLVEQVRETAPFIA